jgi:Na+/H+ antiporter NhaD/arsenite permease-like protein
MLWMGGEITVMPLIKNVFLPSLACVTGATAWQLATLSGPTNFEAPAVSKGETPRGSSLVAAVGLGGLLFVPAFKAATGLPPFAGMLVSMSALWALTDKLHGADKPHLRMHEALRRIDTAGSLFFLGILLAVGALESSGILTQLAQSLTALVPDDTLIATAIGAVSAVIDNVPLVAAAMGMYDLTAHPVDSQFWDLIAFCAGTGEHTHTNTHTHARTHAPNHTHAHTKLRRHRCRLGFGCRHGIVSLSA